MALKLLDANGNTLASSNYLNAPGLTGKREQITTDSTFAQNFRASVSHTAGIGTNQEFFGTVEATQANIAPLSDTANLSPQMQEIVKQSLRSFVMLPLGKRFRPTLAVSRADLAQAFVRGGRVPQYLAANPLYPDVTDLLTRTAVESAQKSPNGTLFYDSSNTAFRPNESATRIVAAVALVKAANLQSLTYSATLPLMLTDSYQIPNEWKGYVAVALQKGFLSADGNKFAPSRALPRIELVQALLKLNSLAVQ